MATLTPAELLYQTQHIGDDMRPEITVCNGICLAVALISVILRFVSRRIARVPYGTDDWTIMISLGLYAIYILCASLLVHYGMGRHIILLKDPRHFVIYTMCAATLYNATTVFFKLSILYFYHRIFPQRWFKVALIGTGVIVVCIGVTFICTTIFQCIPIDSQWNPAKALEAKCINYPTVVFAAGLINALVSIFILILPLPLIWRLSISAQKKRLIMITFALGGAECIISIIRLAFVHSFKSADATWGNVPTANLTTVELGIGILCACVPAYRPLYIYVFHHNKPLTGGISNDDISSGSRNGHIGYSGPHARKGMGGGKRWNSHRHSGNGYLRSQDNEDEEDAVRLSPRVGKQGEIVGVREVSE